MDKGEFVPLWYYTNKGLENALVTYSSTDNDTLTILCHADGSTSLIPASSTRESKGMVDDRDIKWEDFCITAPRMIEVMARANWPPECTQMMVSFWANIQEHLFHSSGASFKQRALLAYQAEQRQLWHVAIVNPHSGYNLSAINEALLRDTKERLFWEERARPEADRNPHKSFFPHPFFFPFYLADFFSPPPSLLISF